MKIITMFNLKGGTGKTTLTFALSEAFVAKKYRCCIIDLDQQASITNLCTNTDTDKIKIFTDILKGTDIKETVISLRENMALIPSDFRAAIGEIYIQNTKVNIAKEIDKLSNHFDVLFIDCPPQLTTITKNILKNSNVIISVALPDFLSFQSLLMTKQLTDLISKNRKMPIKPYVIINKYRKRINDDKNIYDKICSYDQDYWNVLGSVGESIKVKEAAYNFSSIITTEPTHKITKEIISIADKLIKKENL